MAFRSSHFVPTSLLAITALVSAGQAQAYNLSFGEDLNFLGTENTRPRLTATPNADAAASSFLSSFDNVHTATFDDLALGTTGPVSLDFEGAATATLVGAGEVTAQTQNGQHPISGDNYWLTFAGDNGFQVNFDEAVAGFGFYATDIGDVGATVQIELGLANGGTQLIDFPHDTTDDQSGSILYQGIIAENEDELFNSVRFITTGGNDGFGFDNLTVGSFDQVNDETTVPEPGPILGLLLVGLCGTGVKLKRHQS
ncbi:MAG: PEP-CTERM sorting domain-containing protein [Leptolyngbya sp. SIO3F4]|nr:PEP-CTERM sorting domain-containing protein [Leptolyngbya sp. SIO3F4]